MHGKSLVVSFGLTSPGKFNPSRALVSGCIQHQEQLSPTCAHAYSNPSTSINCRLRGEGRYFSLGCRTPHAAPNKMQCTCMCNPSPPPSDSEAGGNDTHPIGPLFSARNSKQRSNACACKILHRFLWTQEQRGKKKYLLGVFLQLVAANTGGRKAIQEVHAYTLADANGLSSHVACCPLKRLPLVLYTSRKQQSNSLACMHAHSLSSFRHSSVPGCIFPRGVSNSCVWHTTAKNGKPRNCMHKLILRRFPLKSEAKGHIAPRDVTVIPANRGRKKKKKHARACMPSPIPMDPAATWCITPCNVLLHRIFLGTPLENNEATALACPILRCLFKTRHQPERAGGGGGYFTSECYSHSYSIPRKTTGPCACMPNATGRIAPWGVTCCTQQNIREATLLPVVICRTQ